MLVGTARWCGRLVVTLVTAAAAGCGGGVDDGSATGQAVQAVEGRDAAAHPPATHAAPAGPGGSFGRAVALSDEVLAVGSPNESPGAVQLFERRGGGWFPAGRLEATEPGSGFGQRLALHGHTLAIGEAGAAGGGRVHLYGRSTEGWRLEAVLTSPDPTPWGEFGASLALGEDTLVVAAPGEGVRGLVYAFERHAPWRLVARVEPGEGLGGNGFANHLALAGDTLVVAAQSAEPPTVVVYRRHGWQWVEEARLVEPEADGLSQFANRVAVAPGLVAVNCTCPEGEIYLFERREHGWVLAGTLRADFGEAQVLYGHEVALSGWRVLVGAPRAPVDGLPGAGQV